MLIRFYHLKVKTPGCMQTKVQQIFGNLMRSMSKCSCVIDRLIVSEVVVSPHHIKESACHDNYLYMMIV